MSHKAKGVVALEQGRPVSLETILVPDPGRVKPWSTSKPAVSATPTCTTGRGGFRTIFRSFWAMRQPAKWWLSVRTSAGSSPGPS